ncbi:protein of unknown function [Nitrospira japonica]|uniref:Uncharacterized protein n=1 Tax=Nitrospira japonica TaxID=1325564 RepID=A0A1W1I1A5_9BACT|nr:protein of unknown function [Nitrospira japonica]
MNGGYTQKDLKPLLTVGSGRRRAIPKVLGKGMEPFLSVLLLH